LCTADVPRRLAARQVEVPEIPYREIITLPASSTALVVVDMQNDFVKPEGSLHVEASLATVPRISGLLMEAREKGVRVAYTQDSAVPGDPEFDQALILRQVSSLYGGHVCKSWQAIRLESG
jgi:nicotinamidase-related amidase